MISRDTADKWLLLDLKKLLLIPSAWVACVVLHNLIYGLFQQYFAPRGDEPFFFLLAVVVIPCYALACLVYTAARLFIGPNTFTQHEP